VIINLLTTKVHFADDVAVIDLKGDINAGVENALNVAYIEAGNQNPRAIPLNFRDVSYIKRTGIALIVNLLAKTRKSGLRLLTCDVSDHYAEIFKITRLIDYLSVFPDDAGALNSFGN
jgi:anti-anti-sigma factor